MKNPDSSDTRFTACSSPPAFPPDRLGNLPPRIEVPPPGPRSLAWGARLMRVETPDLASFRDDFPIFWEQAIGANVIDADGNRYVDLNAGFGVAAAGHSHPRVVAAIREGSESLIHGMGDVHPTALRTRLAEAVVRLAPGRSPAPAGGVAATPGPRWKTIFGTSGADAVEAARKTAAIATGRPGLIAFDDAYHGLSLGSLAATAWPAFREGLSGLLGDAPSRIARFPFPRATPHDPALGEVAAGALLARIDDFLDSPEGRRMEIGAALVEPIQGRGGTVVPPAGFLAGLVELCRARGMISIFDEVYTGFGRAGAWFACEIEGVVPDLIAAGKALGGGMPISICLGRADVIDAWGPAEGESRHTHTFLGHPLSCAAALAALGALEGEGLVERSAAAGDRFRSLLGDALCEAGHMPGGRGSRVREVRGRGMMIGMELDSGRGPGADRELGFRCMVEAMRAGLIVLTSGRTGSVVSLTPPLILADERIEEAARILTATVARVAAS